MAEIKPFRIWCPRADVVGRVAASPYDTFSRAEATVEIAREPLSFLRIDKPAALVGEEVGEYDLKVYTRALEELEAWYEQRIMVPVSEPLEPAFLIYRLSKDGRVQTGILALASAADYQNGTIKRHENTRPEKEQDRIDHIQVLRVHSSPVLMTYPSQPELDAFLRGFVVARQTLFDFETSDGVRHEVWQAGDADSVAYLQEAFASIATLYIADGHHRAAAAAHVAELEGTEGLVGCTSDGSGDCESAEPGVQKSKESRDCESVDSVDCLNTESAYQKSDESQFFLVALFGSDELRVFDYNRIVSDLAGLEPAELLASISTVMDVVQQGPEPYRPIKRGEYGMYLDGSWYQLTLHEALRPKDAVDGLDVAVLHDSVLEPFLGIENPRTSPRIAYVGGSRGLEELARRAHETGGVAFALYPCSLAELFAVADEDRLMPPKSTWFEFKPRSGLAIHRI